MQLILIRHGLPENAHTRNAKNPQLSEAGQLQAQQTCERLAREPIDAIYASPLHRARESGAPLSALLNKPIRELPAIGEVDNGEDAYISPEAIKSAGEWEQFLLDPIRYYGHDEGEFKARVLSGFAQILDERAGKRIAVFTHAFPINIILSHALGLSGVSHFVPRNGSLSRVMGGSLETLKVLSVNETSHFSKEVTR